MTHLQVKGEYDLVITINLWLLFFQALSDEANELLPVFNKTSSKHYRASVGTHDWSAPALHALNQPVGMRQFTTLNHKGRISLRWRYDNLFKIIFPFSATTF